jgi:hypothetical protein
MLLTPNKVETRQQWLKIMKEGTEEERLKEREEALEMMREGLAIQMYNELHQYSSKQQEVAFKKAELQKQLLMLQNEILSVEKEERLIQHEITSRKDMLKKLAKKSVVKGEEGHEVSRNIG